MTAKTAAELIAKAINDVLPGWAQAITGEAARDFTYFGTPLPADAIVMTEGEPADLLISVCASKIKAIAEAGGVFFEAGAV